MICRQIFICGCLSCRTQCTAHCSVHEQASPVPQLLPAHSPLLLSHIESSTWLLYSGCAGRLVLVFGLRHVRETCKLVGLVKQMGCCGDERLGILCNAAGHEGNSPPYDKTDELRMEAQKPLRCVSDINSNPFVYNKQDRSCALVNLDLDLNPTRQQAQGVGH